MNILYTNFHPRNGGGHATYIINLAKQLGCDHKITIATPATSRLFKQAALIDGVTCIDTAFSTRAGAMLAEVRKLRSLIRRGNFDLVHVNGSADHRQVMLATMFLANRPKIIWTKHNTMPISSFGNWLRAKLGCDGAIGVSNFVSSILQNSAFAAIPIRTIYHGVDTNRFKPRSVHESSNLKHKYLGETSADSLVLASVGGTDRDKGWLLLAQAIAGLEAVHRARIKILMAGDYLKGKLLEDFKALNLEDVVIFPGLVSNPEDILAAADIGFVLSYHEAFSFAAAESLASGLPTLVSDAGGLPEVVRSGTDGWVVPKENISAIKRWLEDILIGGLDSQMSVRAREHAVEMFALPVFAKNTMDFYKQVCAL